MSKCQIMIAREDINNKDEVDAHFGEQACLRSHELSAGRYSHPSHGSAGKKDGLPRLSRKQDIQG